MDTIYEVWRTKTGDTTYYQNLSDAMLAALDIFMRDSKGIDIDMRECWGQLMEEYWIEGFCAVAAIKVKDEFFSS